MSDFNNDDAQHTDQLTLNQMASISSEVASQQPMISEQIPIDSLLPSYEGAENKGFVPGIKYLAERYRCMRRVRGDGNCFYRAVLFGYLERLLTCKLEEGQLPSNKADAELDRMKAKIAGSMHELVAVGYEEYAIEVFYDVRLLHKYMKL